MFRFLELELHGWDYWQPLRIPLNAGVVVLSGPNGSGKTTMLDAIRQILHAGRLSQNRRISHYLRLPNEPALLRAVVSNRADQRGRRPFERQQVLTDEATLACALVPNGGSPEKRFAVLPGKVAPQDLQNYLLEGREWLQPDQYRRVLENAGVSRSLMHILALEQGRADELSHQKPRELFRWIMEARGAQEVLERYTSARRQYEDSVREVSRQNEQVLRYQATLGELERKIRRLDEHIAKKGSVKDAEDIKRAAPLQEMITQLSDIEKRLPDVRTRSTALATTVDRLQRDLEAQRKVVDSLCAQSNIQTEIERIAEKEWTDAVSINARLSVEVERKQEAAAELATIREEDKTELEKGLACARSENFRAEQLRLDRISDLEQCEKLIADLERGIRHYPNEVKTTLEALTNVGVNVVLMAERVEISDTSWTTAVESALGNLRYAICVRQDQEKLASEIARAQGFLGPIVSTLATITESTAAGPLKFNEAVPEWIIDWGRHIILSDSAEIAAGGRGLAQDGIRRDDYGLWVGQAADRVLGGSAIRHQLEQARQRHEVIALELAEAQKAAALSAQSVEEIEGRLTRQNRRNELLKEVASLPELQRNLAIATAMCDSKKEERDRARESLAQALRAVLESERLLDQKQDELEKRTDELERNRAAVTEMETKKAFLESDIDVLKPQLSRRLIDEAEAGKLPPLAIAERELERAKRALLAFENEGEIPDEIVRQERLVLQRNLEDLEQHVQARQREADSARLELEQCRGDYLNVIRSTLHDYSKRARALAEMASAKLEIELPDLRNDDRSLDEAGIVVRIGFDGKPPTELGDTGHSGGQQVIAGLILLMSMAETEGDSFFIVDEPFAHLSLDRVDDVGKFLRRSGAQFLITVPTTLDRGQLDPASLLIVLSKKPPDAVYAPSPIVARTLDTCTTA